MGVTTEGWETCWEEGAFLGGIIGFDVAKYEHANAGPSSAET